MPSIAVVVTNHNYGHFLPACLGSLAAQSRPADQIIVVDDGSTDASRAILRAEPPGLTIIEQDNRGQAGAFNAGFARVTSDLVLFLDADDTLTPDALETLAGAFHDDFSAIAFGLGLIDGAGQPSGTYPVEAFEGDPRPDLLARGHFRFMPTSGNVFNARRIAPGFPLPEARWRISADAVLLRIAALAGPIRALPLTLGNYRAHGGNAYHRSATPELRFLRRATEDMADATLAVADLTDDTLFGPDPDLVRFQLLLAFLRLRLQLPDAGAPADRAGIGAARHRIARLRIGRRARATCTLALALLPLALRVVPAVRRWVPAQDRRPRWLDAALAWALGPAFQARRRALHRPRWLAPALPGQHQTASEAAFYNAFDWRDLRSAGRRLLCHPAGEILVALPHLPDGARLSLDLRATDAVAATPIAVTLALGDEPLARREILGRGRIALVVEGRETLGEAPLRLCLTARTRTGLRGPATLLEVTGLCIEPLPPPQPRVLLGAGEGRRFAEIASACQQFPPLDRATPTIATGRLVLGLMRPVWPGPCDLVLRFGPGQPAGTLVASALGASPDSGPLRRGRIGPGAEMRIPLPARRTRDDGALDLALDFDPLDPFDAPGIDLDSLGIAGDASEPLVVPGTLHTFGADPDPILGDGWIPDPSGALLFDMLGTLAFAVGPSAAADAELRLRLAPAEPLPPDATLAVAVTAGAAVLAQVRLCGEHELAVPLTLADGDRHVALSLHAALLIPEDGAFAPRRGALRLSALHLVSTPPAIAARPLPAPEPPRSLAARIVAAVAETRPAAVIAARERIRQDLHDLAPGAVRSEILTSEALERLLALAPADDAAEAEGSSPAAFDALFADNLAEAGRALALAILSVPPWVSTAGQPIGALHDALRAFPAALARYLCAADTVPETALTAYRTHVLRLYRFARGAFLATPRDSRNHRLAEEILHRLHPHPLLFAAGSLRDLGLARARAIEAWLLSRGNRIALPRRRLDTRSGRLRLGVLLRSLGEVPESWILRGTLGQLDARTFDITLFLAHATEGRPVPMPESLRVVPLDGVGIDASVEAIRAAELDMLLLGTFFLGHDKIAAIAAHRLAPVQVATSAVSPMTTGMQSFDILLSSRSCEPPDAATHYTERLHLADFAIQRFDFGDPPEPAENRRRERARLGLPPDRVVLISGAALGKIGAALLDRWLEVLLAAPDAVLVLYPFARNWRKSYARRAFEHRLDAACAVRGIDRRRLLLLDDIDHATVRRLLALSDVYLDSFPYAGATTVVEALDAGLPVVGLAGDSQRGLQGAAWLRDAGLGDLVADTQAAYAATAARLANSADARAAAHAAIRLPATADPAFGRRLGALLFDLAGMAAIPPARLIFHHMPKAGGTSCREIFAGWFPTIDDDRPPWSLAPAPPPPDPAAMAPETLVCGHFNSPGYLLRERYPAQLADPRWRLITFLRDPLETAISYYFFERAHRPKVDPGFCPRDLDSYLAASPGHLAEHLASIADDWGQALDRYWFVGTLDRLDESLRWLAEAFGKPPPLSIARRNHAPRTEQPSDAAIDAFLTRHAEEFAIYRAAAARAAAILATDPRSALDWP